MSNTKSATHKAQDDGKFPDQNEAINDKETKMATEGQGANAAKSVSKDQETHKDNLQDNEKLTKIDRKKKKKKALLEFRCLVEDAILGNYLLGKPKSVGSDGESRKAREQHKDVTLWGVPLLPSRGHEGTDNILTKFLKAKDYKVHDAFEMLRKTLKWRRDYNTDSILEEKLDPDMAKVLYVNSRDREGHPLYFNVYGALSDKDLYQKVFGSQENCEKFLRCRVQFFEKSIKELNFKSGGADSIVQITDLKNSPGPGMKELRSASKKALMVLQQHYPQLIHKDIIINVPFWYYASHALSSKLLSQRAKNRFIFARPSKVTKTLLKFISPENLPVEYGGLKRENEDDFSSEDKVLELIVKKNSTSCIQIPVSEVGVTVVWDLTVVGWDVSYKEEFVPDDEGSYNVLLHREKEKKGTQSVRNSFYINEPGNIVITIDNWTYKKKRVLYRYKTKPTFPMYIFFKK